MEKSKPYVILSAAISVDGKIATRTGDSKLSSKQDSIRLHKLRSKVDAILVGKNTVLRDNPLLTVRYTRGKNPIRIVLDSKGIISKKSKILKNTSQENLANFMKNTCHSMIRKGITTFVDFREGGLAGVALLKKVLSDIPLRSIILGRVEFYQEHAEIRKNLPFPREKIEDLADLLKKCDGIGISGANENSTSVLNYYSKTTKLRVIHSSETKQSVSTSKKITGKSETVRALSLKPHFLVHMTFASKGDLCAVAKKTRGIVICPRANSSLAEGIPDIELMHKAGCTLALGTDNVMINSPDMFREMDFLWKVTMGIHKKRINPKEILKMATVNGGKLLKKDIGVIETGKIADCIFLDKHALDLEPMHNPYASIVHRASESAIRAIMIGGKIVYGKI